MPDFLLELFSEEIPARMQRQAAADLARLFGAALGAAGVAHDGLEAHATPRRLALIARGLPQATAAVSEERRGPRADAPAQAVEGFLKSTGLTRDRLEARDDAKGRFLYAVIDKPGRATAEVIADIVPALLRDFPWPKSMRWGSGSFRWVRPLHSVVALLGDEVVPFEVEGIAASRTTWGHRVLSSGPIEIMSAATYAAQLRAAHVILSADEREAIIRDGAEAAARNAGFALIDDAGLIAENAGLTEWPVPLLGTFDPEFLDVPPEVIQLTMRANQKYFACSDPATGNLAPAFVCVANTEASDGGAAIVAGNRKVLAARLSDARFFWEQDRKTTLESRLPKLADIVFHEKLGTVADKVERVAKLARWLVESGAVRPAHSEQSRHSREGGNPAGGGPERIGSGSTLDSRLRGNDDQGSDADVAALATLAETAARLCKADLVTGMVGEFPELQGVMGGHYARAEGLDPRIADAIRDHYKPVGQADDVPTAPVTVAVALADKLDTLAQFFRVGLIPTGSKDPFALRRAGLGVLQLIIANGLRVRLFGVFTRAIDTVENWGDSQISDQIMQFLVERLKVQQRDTGVRHDLIDSVFHVEQGRGRSDDLVGLLNRVHALQSFVATDDGANLLAGYKRAANILRIEEKKDGRSYDSEPQLSDDPYERSLSDALDILERDAASAITREDFAAAMAALARLRPFVDAFFDHVTVNDPEPGRRANRLALLNRIRAAVHSVADFSKIEG